MKDSEALYNLLSSIKRNQELIDLNDQIEEFGQYVKNVGICIKKRQLIIYSGEKFRCKGLQELMCGK